MKRLLSVFLLILIVGALFSPFTLAAEKSDFSETITQVKGSGYEISKYGGESKVTLGKNPDTATTRVEILTQSSGVKYNWVLSTYPGTNVFTMPLSLEGAQYYYQPPLNAGAYPAGWTVNATHAFDDKGVLREYRPIDVVGSYAVYGLHKDNEYGTGKILHIYRPLVIDAAGKTSWGTMHIEAGTLSVTVDDKWLKTAKYPVTVDPTFGTTGIGGSDLDINNAAHLYGTQVTTPAAQNIHVTKFSAYVKLGGAGARNWKGGIWANTDGGALTGATGAGTCVDVAYSWRDAAYAADLSVSSSTAYMIGILSDGILPDLWIKYDTGTGGTGHQDTVNSYAAPGAFDWSANNDYVLSLYATYYSVPTITSSVISDLDDTDNVYTMKKYYTFTTIIADSDGATNIASISIRGAQGASVRWMVNATTLNGVPAYAITTGDTIIDLDAASCSFTESGINGTLVLKVRFEWDYSEEVNGELEVWAADADGHTVGWTTVQSNYYDVVSRLNVYLFASNATSITTNTPIAISGYVRYAMNITGSTEEDYPSSSYPPDAQFTAVKIYDDFNDLFGTDSAIVNGAFSVAGNSINAIRTTIYTAYLDLADPYVDGFSPDLRYVTVTTTSNFFLSQLIEQAAAFFGAIFPGAATFLDGLTTMTSGISAFFGGTIASIVNGVTMVFKILVGFAVFALDWGGRMADWVVDITTEVLNILNGTSAAATGLGNIWTLFNVASWIDFIPLMLILFWLESLDVREKRQGGGWVQIAIGDIQIATYILGLIMEYSWMVFNFVFNTIVNLASLIPGL